MSTTSFEALLAEKGSFCYKNVGVSMLPLIREGRDIIAIQRRPEARLKKYDVAFFVRPGIVGRGAYVLHRVLRVNPDGTYWIVGDNCIGGETVREENVIGVLSAVMRNGKDITKGIGYWLYIHSNFACRHTRIFLGRVISYLRRILIR